MTMTVRACFFLALFVSASTPAISQTSNHTYVSGGGTGNCTRASPCGSFLTALQATTVGGVITVLSGGDFQGLPISKSITVRAVGNDGGYTDQPQVNSGAYAIGVEVSASDVVNLEGLHISGTGGLLIQGGGTVNVNNCVFENEIGTGEAGILIVPNAAVVVNISNTIVLNNGTNTGGGIIVRPQSGGSARIMLDHVKVNGNAFGIAADGSTSTAGINLTVSDSVIGGNKQDGIIATSSTGGAPIALAVTNSRSVNNAYGIRSLGSNVTVRVKNSDIIGNGTGLSGGGALLTGGGNTVQANGTNGGFTGSYAQQ